MTVAAKCNITSSALKVLNELYWGTKDNTVDDVILENYAESLGCSVMNICNEDNCINLTETLNCALVLSKISVTTDLNTATFFIADGDLTGGKSPYKYTWSYEEEDFDNSGEVDIDEAVLTVKLGKKLDLLVSLVSVNIVDDNGCIVNKGCYITPTGMQCATDYVSCPNVTGLVVNNKVTKCFGVSGLIVNKKL